jgi:hypothetical protein
MKKFVFLLSTLLLVFLVASSAQAIATLQLSDGSNTVTIVDQGPGDGSNILGVVSFNGGLPSSSWTVNITTGITKPVIGDVANPSLDLNSVNVSGGGAGTLTILFSDNNFAAPTIGMWNTAIGGTTNGTLQ